MPNLVGSALDKSLPFIISIILINIMSNEGYGFWVEYFQILILISSTLLSPLKLFFSKDFFKTDNAKILFYNTPFVIFIVIVTYVVIYLYYPQFYKENYILELISLIFLYVSYSYIGLYLRFEKRDQDYMIYSLLRFILFGLYMLVIYVTLDIISFQDLIRGYLICHIPILLIFRRKVSFQWKFQKPRFSEFLQLSFYGGCTALLSGVDRLIIVKAGYNYEELGSYAYALSFASIPSFIIEGVKQYMSPKIFNDLSQKGIYSFSLKKKLFIVVLILSIVQLALPNLVLALVDNVGLFKSSLISYVLVKSIILTLNIGFIFHIIYHFINPILFYYNKSMVLLGFQVIGIMFFIIAIFNSESLTNSQVSVFRMIMYISVVLMVVLYLKFNTLKSNCVTYQNEI